MPSPGAGRGRVRVAVTAALGSMMIIATSGCGSSNESGSTSTSSGSSDTAVKTVRIGDLMSTTGACAGIDVPAQTGLEMVVDDINRDGLIDVGGQKYHVELVKKDTKTDNATGVAAMQSLVRDEGVNIVVGPWCGGQFEPGVRALAEKSGIMYLSAGANDKINSTTADLSKAIEAAKGPAKNIFSLNGTFWDTGFGTANELDGFPDADKIKKVSMLVENSEAGRGYGAAFAEGLKARGATVDMLTFDPSTKDFSGFLARIKASHPDLLIFGITPATNVTILKQAVEQNAAPRFLGWGSNITDFKDVPVPSVVQVHVADLQNPTTPKLKQIADEYLKRTGSLTKTQSSHAVDFYDPMLMLAKAMSDAGSVSDIDKISAALEQVKHTGVASKAMAFDEAHNFSLYVDACYIAPNTSGSKAECTPVRIGALAAADDGS